MGITVNRTVEGFEGTWVELSPRWTRAEYRELLEATGDTWFTIFEAKVEGFCIQTSEGDITTFEELTEEALNFADMEVLGFLDGCMLGVVAERRSMGFSKRSISSNGKDEKSETTKE